MRAPAIPEGTLTFADYFRLNADIEDILAELGYSYRIESSELPKKELVQDHLDDVRSSLEDVFPHVNLINETARREFLIAPVLMEVARETDAKISVELALEIDERLRGTLDYLVRAKHHMVVIEAKNGDLKRGFTQLAVELIALDHWLEESPDARFYGAVSMGNIWQFGILDRAEKEITEDLNTYRIPQDLTEIIQVLVAVLSA